MRKNNIKKIILLNLMMILIAIFISLILWYLLGFIIQIDNEKILSSKASFEFYRAQKGMIGFWILLIIDIVTSLLYYKTISYRGVDKENNNPSNQNNSLCKNAVVVIRMVLSIYLLLFSYNSILHSWFRNLDYVFGINPFFIAWPVLFIFDSAISFYLIVYNSYGSQTNIERMNKYQFLGILIHLAICLVTYGLFMIFAYAQFPLKSCAMIISTIGFISLLICSRLISVKILKEKLG